MADLFASPAAGQIDTLADALKDLCRLFPKNRDEIVAWTGSYARAIGHLTGQNLRTCYHATVDAWQKANAPKPADFKANIPSAAKPVDKAAEAAAADMRMTNAAERERDALVKRTMEHYEPRIAEEAQQHYEGERDRKQFAYHVERLVRDLAWPIAVETAKGAAPAPYIELTAAVRERAHGRTQSQQRHVSGDLGDAMRRRQHPEREAQRARHEAAMARAEQQHQGEDEHVI